MTTTTSDPEFDAGLPDDGVMPYGGTSGRGGSQASAEAREREDADGTTARRQREVVAFLDTTGPLGATWRDLAAHYHWHHGMATGALSNLHKAGVIARLATVQRVKCSVYVLPEHVGNRPTAAYGRNRAGQGAGLPPLTLTKDEADLLATVRSAANADRDKPTVHVRKEGLRRLVALIDRVLAHDAKGRQ